MIKIAYCNVENLNLKKAYNLLSKDRKNKVNKFYFEKDKKLSAGAYLLLVKLLSEVGVYEFSFKFGKYDKPYISSNDNIYFNLSHSNKMVACAISDMEVGIDVELIDPEIDLNIANHYFFNEEYDSIINSKNPANEFFNYWVLKESYMKYTGLGFQLNLDAFQIVIDDEIRLENDKNSLQFSLFDIYDYKLAICSKYNVNEVVEYFCDDLY